MLPLSLGDVPLLWEPRGGIAEAVHRRLAPDYDDEVVELIATTLLREPLLGGVPRHWRERPRLISDAMIAMGRDGDPRPRKRNPRIPLTPDDLVRRRDDRGPDRAKPYWQLEAAFRRDLEGLSSGELASNYRLTGHLLVVNGKIKAKNHSKDASRSYINPGREFLAELGAWPWAVAREARGRLPRHWHHERAFADALPRGIAGAGSGCSRASRVRLTSRPDASRYGGGAGTCGTRAGRTTTRSARQP